ncbi:MAG: VCBS repeat-containing protein, partial [Calditrichaeota bacterium]|nr:VCBS repeat-containing protein [Calditrichota bacterium]
TGLFSEYIESTFSQTHSFLRIIVVNRIWSEVVFIFKKKTKKDLVTVRYSNINVYHNDNGALTQTVQNIQNQGGVATDVGNFNWQDDNEDLAVMGSGGVVCVYRNRFDGLLDESPYIFGFTSGSQNFKMKQIDDKSLPYFQNDPNNRFDIVTTQGSTVKIFLNNSNNGIYLNQSFDAGFSIKGLEVADVNDDGFSDIIVAGGNSTSTSMAKVFLNLTNGFINTNAVYSSSSGFISYSGAFLKIALSDLNNDGFNDLTFMGYEGNTKVFINTGSGSYFSQTANQSIQILNNFGEITQVKSVDIYNTGGKALIYSAAVGGGAINERDWGLIRLNAVNQNIAPAPPIVKGSIKSISGYNRPKILILSNRETPDFQKYEIYKSKASTDWNFNYCGYTTSNEFIDNTEYVLYTGSGDAPPPNCYYAVKTVDLANNNSNLSNQLGYRVGDPICPTCGEEVMEESGDNSIVNFTPDSESNLTTPTEFSVSNFPNPFNPVTKIYYNLPIQGNVKIEIYNSKGQMIKELV